MKTKLMMCLMALSVAVAGYISCVIASNVHWHYVWISASAILPGLSFGLATAGWLLHRSWISRRKAAGFIAGSTVAYFAAYWSAFYIFILCHSGMILSESRLPLFHAGMIGGLVGTALLTASLAAVSADFRRKDWKTLIIIGTAAGGALCLAGIGAKSFDHAGSLANPGDRVFIVVWQLLVSGYIGVLLFGAPSFSSGPSERGRIALWARRAVWALLLVSVVHAGIGFSRREKESTAASSATSGSSAAQPSTKLDADATAWANSYRSAKFITRAEFVKRVGPVRMVIRERGVSENVPNFASILETSAASHGLTIVSEPSNVELNVDAELTRSKITSEEEDGWGRRETDYSMAYMTSVQISFAVKANCRRGDKFVQLNVYPCRGASMYYEYMGQWVDFNAAYSNAFRQTVDSAFDFIGKFTDADDTDDAAAWNASLWPVAQNTEMYKIFLSPVSAQPGASNLAFYGLTKLELKDIELNEDAGKELNAGSVQQTWINELSRNGQQIGLPSDVRIFHDVDAYHLSRSLFGFERKLCYFDQSLIRVYEKNVVFEFNGELRRADVCIWKDRDRATALPRDHSNTIQDLVSRSIQSAAREFGLNR
jgi:hypothetical protein